MEQHSGTGLMRQKNPYRERPFTAFAKQTLAAIGVILCLWVLNWALPLILEAMSRP